MITTGKQYSVPFASFPMHHIGIAVVDPKAALAFYRDSFGLKLVSGPFVDPIQKVSVCFLANEKEGKPFLELISPVEEASPITRLLARGGGAYHICYEVNDLEKTLEWMRSKLCLVLTNPQPAVAFGGRRIAWCLTPTKHLVEFVELELA